MTAGKHKNKYRKEKQIDSSVSLSILAMSISLALSPDRGCSPTSASQVRASGVVPTSQNRNMRSAYSFFWSRKMSLNVRVFIFGGLALTSENAEFDLATHGICRMCTRPWGRCGLLDHSNCMERCVRIIIVFGLQSSVRLSCTKSKIENGALKDQYVVEVIRASDNRVES